MAIIVVGGHTRNIGKTSVVAGLITALAERPWTAVKITQFGHGICSRNGRACGCAVSEHTWSINEERDTAGKGDTCRFLRAGAQRSIWVRTKQGRLAEAIPALQLAIREASDIIFESNSLMEFIQPDVYLSVLDPGTRDFKASAREFLRRADGIVLHQPETEELAPAWDAVSYREIQDKPIFRVRPPQYLTDEITAFVREKISRTAGAHPSRNA